MVEENFEIWDSEKFQNGSILLLYSPWLKKILRFDILKSSTMVQFYYFLSIILSIYHSLTPLLKKIEIMFEENGWRIEIMINQKKSDIFFCNENFIWETFCQKGDQKETILAKSLLRRPKSPLGDLFGNTVSVRKLVPLSF